MIMLYDFEYDGSGAWTMFLYGCGHNGTIYGLHEQVSLNLVFTIISYQTTTVNFQKSRCFGLLLFMDSITVTEVPTTLNLKVSGHQRQHSSGNIQSRSLQGLGMWHHCMQAPPGQISMLWLIIWSTFCRTNPQHVGSESWWNSLGTSCKKNLNSIHLRTQRTSTCC